MTQAQRARRKRQRIRLAIRNTATVLSVFAFLAMLGAAGADKAAAILDSVSEEIFKTLESADLPAEVNNVIAFLGHCLNDAKAVLKGGSPNE